jgi:hypothetical protein
MSNSINLLTSKNKNKSLSGVFTKLRILRFIAVFFLFGVAASSIMLFILIALSPLPTLQSQERAASEALGQQQLDMGKIALVNERGERISDFLSKRQSFDTIIEQVQSKMPSGGITVTAFTITNNNISVTVSSKSLALLDQFLNKLMETAAEKKDFSRIVLSDFSIDRDTFLMKVIITTL